MIEMLCPLQGGILLDIIGLPAETFWNHIKPFRASMKRHLNHVNLSLNFIIINPSQSQYWFSLGRNLQGFPLGFPMVKSHGFPVDFPGLAATATCTSGLWRCSSLVGGGWRVAGRSLAKPRSQTGRAAKSSRKAIETDMKMVKWCKMGNMNEYDWGWFGSEHYQVTMTGDHGIY